MTVIKPLGLLLAGLMIVALVATALIEGDADSTSSTTTAPLPAITPAPQPPPLLKAGSQRKISVRNGDIVRFRVVNPTAEEVHVHGYDFKFALEPGVTKTISFPARIEGQFEIELEQSATPLAKLVVNPR